MLTRHALSLAGRSFGFRGLPPAERAQLAAAICAAGGAVVDSRTAAARVFELTDCWTPRAPGSAAAVVAVTAFWLREMLRLGEWLEPEQHVFFTPPPLAPGAAGLLSFPEDYDATQSGGGRLEMRMPFAPTNVFKGQVPLWPYYVAYLSSPMRDARGLAAVLKSIMGVDQRRKLSSLEIAIDSLPPQQRALLFETALPEMVRLVLSLPTLFAQHPEVLGPLRDPPSPPTRASVRAQSVTFTKRQALALVSACFFCVFPSQNRLVSRRTAPASTSEKEEKEELDFPHFSMRTLFLAHAKGGDVHIKAEKLRCVLQYFIRVAPLAVGDDAGRERLDAEVIAFTRVAVDLPPAATPAERSPQGVLDAFAPSAAALAMGGVRCEADRLIEDLDGHVQIDFANKFAGGGVFNTGCVQEEIRFLLSPELLLACLVFAKLEPNEAFVVHGTERYARYGGYGFSFSYQGDFADATAFDALGGGKRRRRCAIVGIDAVDYGGAQVGRQYSQAHIWRDLVKAYVGFAYPGAESARWPVASGNWGCGVFRGDAELKFVIQWLAASLAGRDLVYVLFERDHELHDRIRSLLRVLEAVKEESERQRVPLLLAQFLLTLDAALARQANAQGKRAPRPSVLVLARDFLDTQLQGLKRLRLSSPPPPPLEPQQPSSPPLRAGADPSSSAGKASESPTRKSSRPAAPPPPKSPGAGKGKQQTAITAFFGKQQ